MIKKSKTRRGVRAGRSAFLIFFTHFYTLYKKPFIGYDKKIKNAPRSAGWAKRVFDFFSRILTRCIKKSKKQNSKKLEFQTIFEKVTLEPL